MVKLRTGPALVLKRSQGKRNICGKVDDWTLVLKRSQGPRGTFVVKLMTGPGSKEVSRAKRNNCGKTDDRTWF